jgi:hypothetical protein
MALEFRLCEFGSAFATRGRAEELRTTLLERLREDDLVIVDFADVMHVTYSFADELVAKLSTGDTHIETRNMSKPVARVVERALERRSDVIGC